MACSSLLCFSYFCFCFCLSCLALPCPALSCLALPCPALSCLALPCSANVLKDAKDTVYLYDGAGLLVSSCSKEHGGRAVITRHSHCSPAARNFLSKCKLFLCYARLLALLAGAARMLASPPAFLLALLAAHACDIIGRWV
jgi:hypothetical protein